LIMMPKESIIEQLKEKGIENYPSKIGDHRGADREEGLSSRRPPCKGFGDGTIAHYTND
jgi:hypothetical protein